MHILFHAQKNYNNCAFSNIRAHLRKIMKISIFARNAYNNNFLCEHACLRSYKMHFIVLVFTLHDKTNRRVWTFIYMYKYVYIMILHICIVYTYIMCRHKRFGAICWIANAAHFPRKTIFVNIIFHIWHIHTHHMMLCIFTYTTYAANKCKCFFKVLYKYICRDVYIVYTLRIMCSVMM